LAAVRQLLPLGMLRPLRQLLVESPDPDTALNLFERFIATAPPELIRLFSRHHFLLHYVIAVLGYSPYLGEALIRNPDLFQVLLREKGLERSHSREDFAEAFARFRARSTDNDISLLLARFKRREYVRIMLRDLLRVAALAETTAEISALADVLMEEALRDSDMGLRNRYGAPQTLDADGRLVVVPFTVLSLGKLGGNELNYSSDIDLLFLYGDGEAPPGAAISNREYFIRLAQHMTETLSTMTTEGAPFRIDLRLRPQGGEGEPAVGLSHALEYYARRAGDWERQAMIKLRHSAGDQALAREFIRCAQAFVYTEAVNFAAIETALQAREKIGARRRRSVLRRPTQGIDVKLDRGGIRDIEFLVQCLQRVYGGSEPWLRSGGTLFSLQKLHDKAHISSKDFQELTGAYEFFRTLEHRLQLRHGQQTHRLPTSDQELAVFARMMLAAAHQGQARWISDGEEGETPQWILDIVRRRMAAVTEIYTRIVHQQQFRQQRDEADFHLYSAGESGQEPHRRLLDRMEMEAPALFESVQRSDIDQHARRNLYRFLESASTSAERYAAVTQMPEAMKLALKIFGVSDYLTDMLIRHPREIAALEDLAAGDGPGAGPTAAEHVNLFPGASISPAGARDPILDYLARGEVPYTEKMALLRKHYHSRLLASGAHDVMQSRSVWEALEETSFAAEEAIQAAFTIAEAPPGFSIFALGRLGTREHDLLSDADLIFVRAETADGQQTRHAAERVVEILSAYTREGAVFPVDTRLRPHGGEGEIVVTPGQLGAYFQREAQPWEALTYTKLRFLVGTCEVAEQVGAVVDELLRRFAADQEFSASARDMRVRLEKSCDEADNLKTGAGGLYDIDFLVSAKLVAHGIQGTRGNLRQRLASLRDRGLLSAEDVQKLQRHADLLRTAEHAIRLVTGRHQETLQVSGVARAACEEFCGRMLRRDFPEGLEISLRFALVGVRQIYTRLM
jgi:glutamate-ammonia-ligase adenylyltransferase